MPAYLEDGFCNTQPESKAMLSLGSMSCDDLMQFIYISRQKVFDELAVHHKQVNSSIFATISGEGQVLDWRETLRISSRASSLLNAHFHILAAIASQKSDCFSEHVRLLLIVTLRRMKVMVTSQIKQLWMSGQDGPNSTAVPGLLLEYLAEGLHLLDADLKTMKAVLRNWKAPQLEETRFYSHEADGRFSTMESLRRDTFEEYMMDKGLLRGLLRHIFPMDSIVADFGAGSGHYARWLNDTGLVFALAFDGSPDIGLVTRGAVAIADMIKPLSLWRRFDWTMCLEVAEHIPPDAAPVFLRNLDAHTTDGLVISWAQPGLHGLGSVNPLPEDKAVALIQAHTGLRIDEDLTKKIRASCSLVHLANSIFVLVRGTPRPVGAKSDAAPTEPFIPSPLASPACAAEEGWIYAGNDVQMFSAVPTAAACCELCSSNDQCRYWTWSREESHKDLCWIKATREYRISHGGFVSGVRESGL